MEGLVREMQDPETGVPVRCQKLFLTSIPSAFMGYDLIEWLMDRLNIEESVEALHIGNLLCQYGYFFPVSDTKNLVVKDDSSLYRFQTPLYWPWQNNKMPDNVEYAIYLLKRTMRNKQRHGLEEYEMEALNSLKSNLKNKWECITLQADEQVKKAKGMKKCDKIVLDSQERAFWRVNRPPPGFLNSLEYVPIPSRSRSSKPKKRSIEDVQREVDFLRRCLDRTRIKMSVALESLMQYCEMFCEWDPMVTPPQPSNPWTSEDPSFWSINSPMGDPLLLCELIGMAPIHWSSPNARRCVEIPTEKRVRRWAISMEELVSDPTGLQEFTNYLRKEYSHENIRFWLAVNSLRRSSQREIPQRVKDIYSEFLAPGAPCEVNIDGKTMERTQQELKNPSRFTFDPAAEHVYTLLLKKDCYPRFRRSEMYKQLLAAGVQPSAKKRFFNFGPGKKKNQPQALLQQQQSTAASLSQQVQQGSLAGRRRGSDRSLSGSAHELAVSGVRDKDLNRTTAWATEALLCTRESLGPLQRVTVSRVRTPAAAHEPGLLWRPPHRVPVGRRTSSHKNKIKMITTTSHKKREREIYLLLAIPKWRPAFGRACKSNYFLLPRSFVGDPIILLLLFPFLFFCSVCFPSYPTSVESWLRSQSSRFLHDLKRRS
ncbi:hypothetical protein FOCC_FOCC005682 [Frankliniella occidentalis]|nr:hypothetical protein FOCC_FOCC005682 [Frankliniella occidentalis]